MALEFSDTPRDRSGDMPSTGIRIPLEVRIGLDKACKVERRTLSSMIDKIVSDWLIKNGYMEPPR